MDCPRPTTGLEGCNIHPWITAFQSWFLSIQHCHLVITVMLALFLNFSHASDAPLRWVACSAILARPTNLSLTLIPTKILLSFHPCSFLLAYNTLHWLEFVCVGSLQHLDALGEMDWQFLQADICWKQKDFPLAQQHVFDSIHLACFDQV